MQRALSMLTLPLLLAGCVVAPAPVLPGADDVPVFPWQFAPPQMVAPLRNAQSEAFIEASDDGATLLTCLHGEFKEPSLMYASTDAGDSWRELKAAPPPAVGGDCEAAMTVDGGWHYIHTHAAGVTVASTFDQGATWSLNPLSAPPIAAFADRPWLEAAGNNLVLSYSGFLGVQARMSADSGRTWTLPQIVAPAAPQYVPLSGHLVIAPDARTVYQPYLQVPPTYSEATPARVIAGVAVSTDLGRTWTDRPVGPIEAMPLHPALAVQADGTVFYTYYVVNGTSTDFVARSSKDLGRSWSEPCVILPALENVGRAWAHARGESSVDFLIQASGSSLTGRTDDSVVALARAETTRAHVGAVMVLAQERNEFVSLTHDASGKAYVVYTKGDGSLTSPPSEGSALWLVEELV